MDDRRRQARSDGDRQERRQELALRALDRERTARHCEFFLVLLFRIFRRVVRLFYQSYPVGLAGLQKSRIQLSLGTIFLIDYKEHRTSTWCYFRYIGIKIPSIRLCPTQMLLLLTVFHENNKNIRLFIHRPIAFERFSLDKRLIDNYQRVDLGLRMRRSQVQACLRTIILLKKVLEALLHKHE